MRNRASLDSNVFIFGFQLPRSNSRRILLMLEAGVIQGVVTDRVVREVMNFFRKEYGKELAAQLRDFILMTCELVFEADLAIASDVVALVGRKDAGALVVTREHGLARLVSTDRDFAGAPEHRTPRELLSDIGEKTHASEE